MMFRSMALFFLLLHVDGVIRVDCQDEHCVVEEISSGDGSLMVWHGEIHNRQGRIAVLVLKINGSKEWKNLGVCVLITITARVVNLAVGFDREQNPLWHG